jgi:hypothetical protein
VRHIRFSRKDGNSHSELAVNEPSVAEPEGEVCDSLNDQGLSSLYPPPVQVGDESLSNEANLMGHPAGIAVDQPLPWTVDEDLDFLWNDSCPFSEILPARFFDTNFSLVDMSQQYQFSHLEYEQISPGEAQESTNIDNAKRTTAAHVSTAPTRSSFPVPQHLFIESDLNQDSPLIANVDETDPSQNRQLKGNFDPSICPWKITLSDYAAFSNDIKEFSHLLPASF